MFNKNQPLTTVTKMVEWHFLLICRYGMGIKCSERLRKSIFYIFTKTFIYRFVNISFNFSQKDFQLFYDNFLLIRYFFYFDNCDSCFFYTNFQSVIQITANPWSVAYPIAVVSFLTQKSWTPSTLSILRMIPLTVFNIHWRISI